MYIIFDQGKKKKIKRFFLKKNAEKECNKLNNKHNELSHDSLYEIRYIIKKV